jgi:hypothetical protein
MKKICVLVSCVLASTLFGADYGALLSAVQKYKAASTDTSALQTIYDVARSKDADAAVPFCMGLYTLHMGALGNGAISQSGFQALCTRYPDSEVTALLRQLDLFPAPCPTCQGTGSVNDSQKLTCETCKGLGVCPTCEGAKKFAYCTNNRCRKKYTHDELERSIVGVLSLEHPLDHYWNADQSIPCPLCKKNGISSPLYYKKCTACSMTGKCPQCLGSGSQGSHSSYKRCPTCGGIPKTINTVAAKNGLAQLCAQTESLLQKTIDCTKDYEEAQRITDPAAKLNALDACLNKYPGAFIFATVQQTRDTLATELKKTETALAEAQQTQAEREQKLAAQKRELIRQHQTLLSTIRSTSSKRAALVEMNKFLAENPDTPVLVEARLLLAEIEQAVAAEKQGEVYMHYFKIGSAALFGVALLTWLISSLRFTRTKEIVIPHKMPQEPTLRPVPPAPAPAPIPAPAPVTRRAPSIPKMRVLPVKEDVSEESGWGTAVCPECGALLDCPSDVSNENVICASCRKAFHVD